MIYETKIDGNKKAFKLNKYDWLVILACLFFLGLVSLKIAAANNSSKLKASLLNQSSSKFIDDPAVSIDINKSNEIKIKRRQDLTENTLNPFPEIKLNSKTAGKIIISTQKSQNILLNEIKPKEKYLASLTPVKEINIIADKASKLPYVDISLKTGEESFAKLNTESNNTFNSYNLIQLENKLLINNKSAARNFSGPGLHLNIEQVGSLRINTEPVSSLNILNPVNDIRVQNNLLDISTFLNSKDFNSNNFINYIISGDSPYNTFNNYGTTFYKKITQNGVTTITTN